MSENITRVSPELRESFFAKIIEMVAQRGQTGEYHHVTTLNQSLDPGQVPSFITRRLPCNNEAAYHLHALDHPDRHSRSTPGFVGRVSLYQIATANQGQG